MSIRFSIAAFVRHTLIGAMVAGSSALAQSPVDLPVATNGYDGSALQPLNPAGLPSIIATWEILDPDRISQYLLRSEAPLEYQGVRAQTRLLFSSADWNVETDPLDGSLLATRSDAAADEVPGGALAELAALPLADPFALELDARARLEQLGIPPEEIGTVVTRRVQVQGVLADGGTTRSVVHAQKVFLSRSINGVGVEGHRAVLTYTPDGVFRRALLHWPPLAQEGHRLHTTMSRAEIMARAEQAVAARDANFEQVRLRWRLLPSPTSSGDVRLTLIAQASFDELSADGAHLGERVVLDLDLEASE